MIRVTIEALPGGDEAQRRTIHVLEIHNEGPTNAWLSDTEGFSDYSVKVAPGGQVFRVLAHREALGMLELVDRAVTSLRALGAR